MRQVPLTTPRYVEPMLLTLVETPPEGEDWIHEIKYDGYRTMVTVNGAHTQAFTRNGHDWTSKYAPIVHEAAGLKCDTAVLDGEMIVQNQDGISDFGALRSAIRSHPEHLILYAFDLLMLNGRDLRGLALTERRKRLQDLVGNHPESRIHFSEEIHDIDLRGGRRRDEKYRGMLWPSHAPFCATASQSACSGYRSGRGPVEGCFVPV